LINHVLNKTFDLWLQKLEKDTAVTESQFFGNLTSAFIAGFAPKDCLQFFNQKTDRGLKWMAHRLKKLLGKYQNALQELSQ